MSMNILLATGYILTTLLESICPRQLAAAMPIREPVQQREIVMMEVAMTPLMPMTLAVPMMVISAAHTMPIPFSGNCQTGLCMGDHANQQFPSVPTVTVQLARSAAPTALPFPGLIFSVALPAPPEIGYFPLAQIVATVVLRV